MRRSMQDIPFMFRKGDYPGIPEELEELNYYTLDGGHSIMAIPTALKEDAERGEAWKYEIPLPCRYVLQKGWTPYKTENGERYILVDVEYDPAIGACVPEEYDEA